MLSEPEGKRFLFLSLIQLATLQNILVELVPENFKPPKKAKYTKKFSKFRSKTMMTPVQRVVKSFFKCDICLMVFATSPDMMEHMEKHMIVQRPYTCKVCGMGFSDVNSHKRHQDQCSASISSNCASLKVVISPIPESQINPPRIFDEFEDRQRNNRQATSIII